MGTEKSELVSQQHEQGHGHLHDADLGTTASTPSLGQLTASLLPPPPPPPTEPPMIVADLCLPISQSLHARYSRVLADKNLAPKAGRIVRPSAKTGPRTVSYQRAQSARTLPKTPPPPPSAPPPPHSITPTVDSSKGGAVRKSRPANMTTAKRMSASFHGLSRPPPPPPPPPPTPPSHASIKLSDSLLTQDGGTDEGKACVPVLGNLASQAKDALPVESVRGDEEAVEIAPEGQPKKNDQVATGNDVKKRREDDPQPEVFEDEMGDISESESGEELTAEEKAEEQEKKVKKSLLFACLSACGVIFMISVISRLCQRFGSNVEYTADDAMNAAGANAGGPSPVPPPAGAEAAVNAGVAQQMAVAASQSAAASTAAGASSAATVAAAATAAATFSSVTTTAGVVGVSTVAVTGVGMATGIVPVPAFLSPSPEHPCRSFLDDLKPLYGRVDLHFQNLPDNFFSLPGNSPLVEAAFTEAFNKALGACIAYSFGEQNDTNHTGGDDMVPGIYSRFLLNSSLDDWDSWIVFDPETGKQIKYFTTEWSAFVGCQEGGCDEIEPLFSRAGGDGFGSGEHQEDTTNAIWGQQSQNAPLERRLVDAEVPSTVNSFSSLRVFMDSFALELRTLLLKTNPYYNSSLGGGKNAVPSVFYGASFATNDSNTILESEGIKYQVGHFHAGKGPAGAIDRPSLLPICTLPNGNPIPTLLLKEGYVHVRLNGLDEVFFNGAQEVMQEIFRFVYNDMMNGCDGAYSRILEKAEVTGFASWREQGHLLLGTNWTVIVTCDGCADIEPLFLDGRVGGNPVASASRGGRVGRNLEIDSDSHLAKFANLFAVEISKHYPGAVEAYYAASLDQNGVVVDFVGDLELFVEKRLDLVDCTTGLSPTNASMLEEGKFELHVKNLVKDMNKTLLEVVMRDVYNEISGMCSGTMQRVAHLVTIEDTKQMVVENRMIFVGLNISTRLSCTGCEFADEPMFDKINAGKAGRDLGENNERAMFEQFQSELSTQINHLLADFEVTPYYELGASLFESSDPKAEHLPVEIVYGATYDRYGGVRRYGTPVQGDVFAQEEPQAGPDVIVDVVDCEKDLVAADDSRDHGLNEDEYFSFVRSLFERVFPGMAWHQRLRQYGDLSKDVRQAFDMFEEGGIMLFGKKNEEVADSENRRVVRVQAICYFTSHAIKDSMEGATGKPTTAPTSLAPTTAVPTTEAPITAAPTTLVPSTLPPTTSTPTAFPSKTPTSSAPPSETLIVEIEVEWRFKLDPDTRNASKSELLDFTDLASSWITQHMKQAYPSESPYKFESQVTMFESGTYEVATPKKDYSVVAITASQFIFRGRQPTAAAVFEVLNGFDLKSFAKSLWVEDGSADPWIFDNVVALTLATA